MITTKKFSWTDDFDTGIDIVDEQHQQLVDVLNQIGQSDGQGEIEEQIEKLLQYAARHFADEEQLMKDNQMDPRHVNRHTEEHQLFVEEVTNYRQYTNNQSHEAYSDLFHFLSYWLAYHILGIDKSMARQIRDIANGMSAQDAFQRDKKVSGKVEPLLLALNGLFAQVKKRNQALKRLNRSLEQQVTERTHALAAANQALKNLAMHDELTQLPNRRSAMSKLKYLFEQSDHEPLCCIMVDLDFFKQINDTYGHQAGDHFLEFIAKGLKTRFRTDDYVCRMGGDEFLVICPNTHLEGANAVAQKVHTSLSAVSWQHQGVELTPKLSMGIAARTQHTNTPEAIIKQADRALYQAKENGRSKIVCAGD